MAEINIERRERSIWPWMLAGVLLLGLLWYLFARGGTDSTLAGRVDSAALRDSAAAAGTLAPPDTSVPRDFTPPPR